MPGAASLEPSQQQSDGLEGPQDDPLIQPHSFNAGDGAAAFDLYRGTNLYFDGTESDDSATLTLDEAAAMEAQARLDAKRRQQQTTIGYNGVHAIFRDPDSQLAKAYTERVLH